MPSSARKSSIGTARRGIQKAHIPYRGDNPEVGKKTGIAVRHVERMSDGFEPFEELLQQADKRTPPKPKGRKKPIPKQPEFDEADGEMSMDIDDSPIRYLSSARIPSTPTPRAARGSSRPVARTSEVNFDDIPSPRPRTSISRIARAGPSNLSKSVTVRDLTPNSDSDNEPVDYGNGVDTSAMMDGIDDDDAQDDQSPPPQHSSPRRKSFSQIDQDVDMQGGNRSEEDEQPETSPRRDKGKRKARLEDIEEEGEGEEGGAQALDDAGQYDSGEQELEPPSPSPPKKRKMLQEEREKHLKPRSRSKKENREYREGVRRSKREHYKPLEWWRGEKVVYGRTNSSGPVLVPTIKEIRRIPLEPPQPLVKKRGSHRARSKSKTVDEKVPVAFYNPEEDWDNDTEPFGEVYDMDKQALVRRRLVWTAKMVKLSKAANSDWLFEKVFGDADFVAAGQLVIPPKCRKPTKATKDNTYIFYVMEGAVNFKVHEFGQVVATGGMFMAPRGNTYFIENISTRDAKLFFTQARKVPKDDNEPSGSVITPIRDKERINRNAMEFVRSSSPGRPPASSRDGGRIVQSVPPAQQSRPKGSKRAPSAKI